MDRFEAIDENGEKIFFEIINTFGMNESEYAVLKSDIDSNIYILKILYDEQGNMELEGIEDEELNDAIEIYEELKLEQEEKWK